MTTFGPGNHALRSPRWRYIRWADGSEELYDHDTDPDELENRWDDPEYEEVKQELLAELREFRIRSGYRTSDWGEAIR